VKITVKIVNRATKASIKISETFDFNSPPSGGTCTLSPLTVDYDINTKFQVECVSWTDDDPNKEGLLLNWRFTKLDLTIAHADYKCSGPYISTWSSTRTVNVMFPTAGKYVVCSYVRDSAGAITTVQTTVEITNDIIIEAGELKSLVLDELWNACEMGVIDKVAMIVEIVASNLHMAEHLNSTQIVQLRNGMMKGLLMIDIHSYDDVVQLSLLALVAQGDLEYAHQIDTELANKTQRMITKLLHGVGNYTNDKEPIPDEITDNISELAGTLAGANSSVGEALADDALFVLSSMREVLTMRMQGTIQGEYYASGKNTSNIYVQSQRVKENALPDSCGNGFVTLPYSLISQISIHSGLTSCLFYKIPSTFVNGALSRGTSSTYSPIVSMSFQNDRVEGRRRAVDPLHLEIPRNSCNPIVIVLPYTDDTFDDVCDAAEGRRNESFEKYMPSDKSLKVYDGREDGTEPFNAPVCQFYDGERKYWQTENCWVVKSCDGKASCHCTHLTEFTIGVEDLIPTVNVLTKDEIRHINFDNIQRYPTVPITVLLLFMVMPILFYMIPVKNDKHLLAQQMLWSDYQQKIITESYFGKREAIMRSDTTRCKKFFYVWWLDIKNKHPLYGLWMRDRGTNFTGRQRVGILILILLASMATSAAFYRHKQWQLTMNQIMICVVSAFFTSFIPVVATEIFMKHRPTKYKPRRLVHKKGKVEKNDVEDLRVIEGLSLKQIESLKSEIEHRGMVEKLLWCRKLSSVPSEHGETQGKSSDVDYNSAESTRTQLENVNSLESAGKQTPGQNLTEGSVELICLKSRREHEAGATHESEQITMGARECDLALPGLTKSLQSLKLRAPSGNPTYKSNSSTSFVFNTSLRGSYFITQDLPNECTIPITDHDILLLNKIQEYILKNEFSLPHCCTIVTWILLVTICAAFVFLIIGYGIQFDREPTCQAKQEQKCQSLITFAEHMSELVSGAYCDNYDWSYGILFRDYSESTRWLVLFFLSFCLTIFFFSGLTMFFMVFVRFVLWSTVDTQTFSTEDPGLSSLEESKGDPICLSKSDMPEGVNLYHLVENPAGLITYYKKRRPHIYRSAGPSIREVHSDRKSKKLGVVTDSGDETPTVISPKSEGDSSESQDFKASGGEMNAKFSPDLKSDGGSGDEHSLGSWV